MGSNRSSGGLFPFASASLALRPLSVCLHPCSVSGTPAPRGSGFERAGQQETLQDGGAGKRGRGIYSLLLLSCFCPPSLWFSSGQTP